MSEEANKSAVTCNKCNKPKKQVSGSLTQWVFGDGYCECDRDVLTVERAAYEQSVKTNVEFCSTCGKRSNSGRAGSLTQWIFRQESCQCGTQNRDAMPIGAGSGALDLSGSRHPQVSNTSLEEEPDAEEELIALSEADFPYVRYKPLRNLGKGASGAVYKCYDRQLKRLVAIKVLNVLNSDELVQFQNEARASAQLNRPGIVKILDFGITSGGHPYMVMDFIDGMTLTNYLKEVGVMTLEDARYLAIRIADALANAHEHGIFHRDIKPGNVVVLSTIDGQLTDVTLIDFGVAMFRRSDVGASNPTLVGTPLYMSADQAEGRAYDARSEVYSVGCLLYEMLVGTPPFEADSALQLLNLHANAQPPAISLKRADIPPDTELEMIVNKCLAKSPDDRFQSMHELADAIDEIEPLESSSESSRVEVERKSVGSQPTSSKFSKMHLSIFLASVAVCFGVILSLARPKVSPNVPQSFKRDVIYNPQTFESVDKMVDFAENLREAQKVNLSNAAPTFQLGNGTIYLTYKYASDAFIKTIRLPEHELKQVLLTGGPVSGKGLKMLCDGDSLEELNLQELPNLKEADVVSVIKTNHDLNRVTFSNINLSPSIIGLLADLRELRSINFKYVTLSEADLSPLTSLPKLRSLSLRYCKVKVPQIEQIVSIKTLSMVDITGAHIDDATLLKLAQLPRLKVAYVAGCEKVSAQGLRAFAAAAPRCKIEYSIPYVTPQFCDYFYDDNDLLEAVNANAHSIDASDWSITNEGLARLAGKPITHLSVSHTRITDKGFARIAKIPALKSLMMNNMESVSDSALLEVAKLPNLKRVSLNNGTFNDGSIAEMCDRLPKLEDIQANGTMVATKTCQALSRKKAFDSISFEACHLRDSDLALLAKIPGLRVLLINGNTHLSKKGFLALERCHSLTRLQISEPADEETRRSLKERLPKCEISLITDANQLAGH